MASTEKSGPIRAEHFASVQAQIDKALAQSDLDAVVSNLLAALHSLFTPCIFFLHRDDALKTWSECGLPAGTPIFDKPIAVPDGGALSDLLHSGAPAALAAQALPAELSAAGFSETDEQYVLAPVIIRERPAGLLLLGAVESASDAQVDFVRTTADRLAEALAARLGGTSSPVPEPAPLTDVSDAVAEWVRNAAARMPLRPGTEHFAAGVLDGPLPAWREMEDWQGLDDRLLACSHIPIFGAGTETKTAEEAIAILPLDLLCALAVTDALKALYVADGAGREMEAMWEHAACTALTAYELARPCGLAPTECFVVALLRSAGMLAIYRALPDRFAEIRDRIHSEKRGWNDMARDVLLIDPADLAALLARAWNFPPQLSAHVASPQPGRDVATVAALAADLSDRSGKGLFPGGPTDLRQVKTIPALGLTPKQVTDLENDLALLLPWAATL